MHFNYLLLLLENDKRVKGREKRKRNASGKRLLL